MSRSHRKTPIVGNTRARSEKADKQEWAGQARTRQRQWLHDALSDAQDPDLDSDILAQPRGNPRASRGAWGAKDGKHWLTAKPKQTLYHRFLAWGPGEWQAYRAKLLRK